MTASAHHHHHRHGHHHAARPPRAAERDRSSRSASRSISPSSSSRRSTASSAIRSRCWPMPATISSDVLGLVAAWGASVAGAAPAERPLHLWPAQLVDLVALLNAIILLIAVGAIMVEAIERLASPTPVAGVTVIVVALAGVVVNGLTALLLLGGGQRDLNVRSAYRPYGGRRGRQPRRRGGRRASSCSPAGCGSIPRSASPSRWSSSPPPGGCCARRSTWRCTPCRPASTPQAVRDHLRRMSPASRPSTICISGR